jgi:hypothetical protein
MNHARRAKISDMRQKTAREGVDPLICRGIRLGRTFQYRQ